MSETKKTEYLAKGAPRSPVFGLVAGLMMTAVLAALARFDVVLPGDADAMQAIVATILFTIWSGYQTKASRAEQIEGVSKLAIKLHDVATTVNAGDVKGAKEALEQTD